MTSLNAATRARRSRTPADVVLTPVGHWSTSSVGGSWQRRAHCDGTSCRSWQAWTAQAWPLASRTSGWCVPAGAPRQGGPMHVRTAGRNVRLAVTTLACSLTLMLSGASAGASAASPSVTVATGGGGVAVVPGFTAFDPAVVGYEQSEVFLSGTASAYEMTAPVNNDGKYSVGCDEHGAVHHPRRRDATGQSTPFQRNGHRGMVERQRRSRRGPGLDARTQRTGTRRVRLGRRLRSDSRCERAQVGRSASVVILSAMPTCHTRVTAISFDIYSQAGQAIRDNADVILDGLKPKHIIAIGESQSAGRLVTYIDVRPSTRPRVRRLPRTQPQWRHAHPR